MRCFRPSLSVLICGLVVLGWQCWDRQDTVADDFRIQTKVFKNDPNLKKGQPNKPVSETTTIFRAGLVYDFLTVPGQVEEITVFDYPRSRFILLDPTRRVKAIVKMDEIRGFSQQLQLRARQHKEPFLNFLADPKFEPHANPTSEEFGLSSLWMTYEVKTMAAKNAYVAQQYADFADWYAQINAMINPAALPPFARLAVNSELKQRRQLPVKVHLTFFPQEPEKKQVTLEADHNVQWRLIDADLRRVDDAGEHMAAFPEVSLDDYRRPKGTQAQGAPKEQQR
jgi:hypothetical protein